MTSGWAFGGEEDLNRQTRPTPSESSSREKSSTEHALYDHNVKEAMMDAYLRGTLRIIFFILITWPHLIYNMSCPSSCFCTVSGAVKCVGKSITDVPKEMPVHMYVLLLNGTNMNVIKERSLENLNLTLRFGLTHSHLHTIHPQAFHVAPQLKYVKLSFNDLSTLPAQVFSPLTTMVQLHLDQNQLETITQDMFKGLESLEELDLSSNKLTSPASDVFNGLTNLAFLNLGRNSIEKLPPTIFHSLTNLQTLAISYNQLVELEEGIFDGLINLEELKLHYNQISSLPPQVFWSLRNLNYLALSSNNLQAIPDRSFYNMPKMTKLTLYNNPLLSLPEQLMGHMPDMREFYLYSTNLTTVPGNLFANMSGLEKLNLHLNYKLIDLPSDLFCCLPNLQKLSLKSNDLRHLHPNLFSKLTTLSMLYLNNNSLQSLPDTIFQGLERLSIIDLKRNYLKTLPGNIFSSNTALTTVTLSDNFWDCTCSIRDIVGWIRQNEALVADREDVICHSPVYQWLRPLNSLSDEEIICHVTITTGGGPSAVISMTRSSTTISTIPRSTLPTAHGRTVLTSFHTLTPAQPKENFVFTTQAVSNYVSPTFDKLVVEQGPEFVHNNFHNGWVYVWYLPSNPTLAGFLMFCHILLVATGFFLIIFTMYGLYRLNKSMEEIKAEYAQN